MIKAYLYVIKRALEQGHSVAIWSCEGLEWETPYLSNASSKAYTRLKAAVECQDWTNICVRTAGGKGFHSEPEKLGVFAVVLEHGQAPEETINDYVVTPWSDQVMAEYKALEVTA